MWTTKHGEAINKILSAYPPGMVLMHALETYCKTVEDQGIRAGREAAVVPQCEALHSGPSRGAVCRACYEAETGAKAEMQFLAELEAAQAEELGKST